MPPRLLLLDRQHILGLRSNTDADHSFLFFIFTTRRRRPASTNATTAPPFGICPCIIKSCEQRFNESAAAGVRHLDMLAHILDHSWDYFIALVNSEGGSCVLYFLNNSPCLHCEIQIHLICLLARRGRGRRSFRRGVIHLLGLKISYSSIFNWSSTSLLQSMKFSVVQIFFNQAEKFSGVKSKNKLGLFESWNGGWFVGWFVGSIEQKLLNISSARLQQNLEEGCVPAQKRPHSLLVQIRADCYSLSLTLWECVFQHLC